jgi:hypothetical protein
MGMAGGALALLLYYAGGSVALGLWLLSRAACCAPRWADARLRWPLFSDILRVGLAGAVSTVATNVAIAIATGWPGASGRGDCRLWHGLAAGVPAGAAGVRLWGPLVAMVGTVGQGGVNGPCAPPGSARPWRWRCAS